MFPAAAFISSPAPAGLGAEPGSALPTSSFPGSCASPRSVYLSGGLRPATETDLLPTAYRGGGHLTLRYTCAASFRNPAPQARYDTTFPIIIPGRKSRTACIFYFTGPDHTELLSHQIRCLSLYMIQDISASAAALQDDCP